MSITRWMLVPAVLAGWFTAAGPAPAAAKVNDRAGLFSKEAVDKANKRVQEIERNFGRELYIETVPKVPDDLQGKLKDLGKRKFFLEWAGKRAREEEAEGIYVLICKDPGHVEALVDKATRAKYFTLGDRDEMVKKMAGQFEQKKWDEGLLGAVNFVESTLRAHGAKPQRQGQVQANKSGTAAPPAGGGRGEGRA